MIIGVPKEIKAQETRVAITPEGARRLVESGHTVFVQKGAGVQSGFTDDAYAKAGAHLEAKVRVKMIDTSGLPRQHYAAADITYEEVYSTAPMTGHSLQKEVPAWTEFSCLALLVPE